MQSIDDRIILFVNGEYPPWVDQIMILLSDRYVWIPLYVVLALCVMKKLGWKQGLIMLCVCGLAVGLSDWICATAIRPSVARLRPLHPDNPISEYLRIVKRVPRSFSFPSCHAANTFALSTFMSLILRRRLIVGLLFAWAILVCISRAYMAVHYPSDLLAGATIGASIALASFYSAKAIKGRYFAPLLLLCLSQPASASVPLKFEYGGEFNAIFDNREGKGLYTPARTYFLTQLAPEIGFSLDRGRHRVMGGAVWTQPIGCEWEGKRISPTVYYRYAAERLRASIGMFPRTQLIEELPEYLVSDSTRYFQRNLRGAMIQYVGPEGFFEAVCDWRGMQSRTRREAFALIAQGRWQRGLIQAGGTAMLNHLALAKGAKDQHVNDNIIANPYFGLDFMPLLPAPLRFKALSVQVGPIASLTRDRGDMKWLSSVGARAVVDIKWWRLGLRNVLSITDKPLFPLYDRYSNLLNEGEPYYASDFYNRTELSGLLVGYRDIVALHASLDFHVARSEFMFYQRLILTVKI